MLTVHHLGRSQSERIVWLCEELGLAYALKLYTREPSGLAPPEYKALHPFGTAPIIGDGDLVLSESGAIVDYILGRYGGGRLSVGPNRAEFADYVFWFHFANGSMLPALMQRRLLGATPEDKRPPSATDIMKRLDKAYAMIEQRLGEADYFGGPALTAADIMMVYTVTTSRLFTPYDIAPFPNLQAYLARIRARPAYRRARAKGDPDLQD